LIYGCQASPSEKAYGTINDSPEAITFSWDVTTTPVGVASYKPTSVLVIDSTQVDAAALATLEDMLYGTAGTDPRLPLPDEVIGVFAGTVAAVRLTGANAPSYNAATHVVTLPAVTGVVWYVNGTETAAGAQPALGVGETAYVTAEPAPDYTVTGDNDWTFDY
jgi:hypothetical protein